MRSHNFSAGPSALPTAVLERAQREMLDFQGSGMSVMEMSHRGAIYEAVHFAAINNLRRLLAIPDAYEVVFVTGGARTQFALVPYNLKLSGRSGEYILTGTWSEGALKEAGKLTSARAIWSGEADGYRRIPGDAEIEAGPEPAYIHYTSNNTIYGTQFHRIPQVSDAPLVCDMSSDILSKPIDVSRFGLIYAGAQKNMGPAGVTVVIGQKRLLERADPELPEMWSYARIASKDSLLNTPPTFPIYLLKLVTEWLLEIGGLKAVAERNRQKATLLYDAIDGDFYQPHADSGSRSTMNVTFKIYDSSLEPAFLAACEERCIVGVKGHRSVGGLRASIYNAVPLSAVETLVELMNDFRSKHRAA